MAAKIKSIKRTALTITVVLAVIVFYGLTLALWGMTLGNLAVIVVGSVFLAALSVLPVYNKWSAITGTCRLPINIGCHLVAATGFFMSLLLGINYWGRNIEDAKTERVAVVRVYSEEHYRSRKVGRRYVKGESYKMYYIDVELPGGHKKSLAVKPEKYRSYHVGDSVTVKLTPGALGMLVIGR
ncbi:MAG: hypothetical protein K2K94_01405 [Muribaculaceae bacterium]|nr:hypothetical protein [Muribaculaceae bacterium]